MPEWKSGELQRMTLEYFVMNQYNDTAPVVQQK